MIIPHRCGGKCRLRAATPHPPFSFPRKKTGGVTVQKKGVRLAVSGLNKPFASGMQLPARGVAAFGVAIRLDSLLLSAVAQRVQLFELQSGNVGGRGEHPSPFSGGSKGGILFGKRIPPLTGSSAYALHSPSALCAEKRIPPARQPPFTPLVVKQFRGVLCQKNS